MVLMDLDLIQYQDFLKFDPVRKEKMIFDPVRKAYFRVQPEELVRQCWIQFLIREKAFSASSLAVEKQLMVLNEKRRFDLVIYKKGSPVMLCEFKSFNVSIDDRVSRQAAAYNFGLNVPYILLSNGVDHRVFFVDTIDRKVTELRDWPEEL